MTTTVPPGARPALVVAHPGHELRLHHWLERSRPRVLVLTDGSGGSGRSRLASTSRVLAATGAHLGPIYGGLTDRALYAAILARDVSFAFGLIEAIAEVLLDDDVDHVVVDALEGYNPGHDLCHVLGRGAVELASRAGRTIACFDFPLVGSSDAGPAARRLRLDGDALARKLAAAAGYAELEAEVEKALAEQGPEAFRVESLRPLAPGAWETRPPEEPPFYELYGEEQVAAGRYATVLRYREHFAPLAAAIEGFVLPERACAASGS